MFYIILLIGCEPRKPKPDGDVLQGDQTGYWRITGYEFKGRGAPLSDVPGRHYLEISGDRMKTDKTLIMLYRKGTPFRTFIFYDKAILKTFSLKGVFGSYDYNKKKQQNLFWYRINEESGFLAIADINVETGIIKKIRVSGVIASATYKPELDSLRFIYEPTTKFK